MLFGNLQKLGRMLEHGENGSLDVNRPRSIVGVRADGVDVTILEGHHRREFLQSARIDLIEK